MTDRTKTRRLHIDELLDDDEAIADYIDDSLAEDSPAELAHSLGVVARARGMSLIAQETGLSRAALYRSLGADGNPEIETVMKVLKALRLKLSVTPANAAE